MGKLKNRIDFIYLIDVQDGNPNGDPDAGNAPRQDPETSQGLITDVCLKRKVRNYVDIVKSGIPGYDIFIREKTVLNTLIEAAHDTEEVKTADKKKKTEAARTVMCRNYFDIRTFGAVMSTGAKEKNAGQVRGPIQMTFARSIDPIEWCDNAITRMAVTAEKDEKKERTIGRKATVPYGLYLTYGFISPSLAAQTGFSEEDLNLFMSALQNMFDFDRSAARGLMSPRKLIVFRHESESGNAPAHKLFELVKVTRKNPDKVARSFNDYTVTIDRDNLPEGVTVEEIL
ncbi:MAG: type I-C CRISPR-associated protein Cas7/Csd2 [Muribaculaceae bacterium]|nr:type I-C CRISPR-associated protein Cas7/Csd2 [Muribaculaceae bacterium]